MKKKFTDFIEMLQYIKKTGYEGDVYINNENVGVVWTVINEWDFSKGYNTLEIEEPKSDRDKVADMLMNNEWVRVRDRVLSTNLFHINNDYVAATAFDEHNFTFGYFLEKFTPSNLEEREQSLRGTL